MDRLGADLDAWTLDQRQTARDRRHGLIGQLSPIGRRLGLQIIS
jgi:hypothetical protein